MNSADILYDSRPKTCLCHCHGSSSSLKRCKICVNSHFHNLVDSWPSECSHLPWSGQPIGTHSAWYLLEGRSTRVQHETLSKMPAGLDRQYKKQIHKVLAEWTASPFQCMCHIQVFNHYSCKYKHKTIVSMNPTYSSSTSKTFNNERHQETISQSSPFCALWFCLSIYISWKWSNKFHVI